MLGVALVAAALAAPVPTFAAGQTATIRLAPPDRATRVYLAPAGAKIRSAVDGRLHFVGVLQRGKRALRFVVPPLDTGPYVTWCRGCVKSIRLRIRTPISPCPVTLAANPYGNGLLSTRLPRDGLVVVEPENVTERGLWWTKLIWSVRPWSVAGGLAVSVERIGAPARRAFVQTVRGDANNFWSWAARMYFPSEGCWRVTGRVEDLSLSFVVQVVIAD
ncbi:MAG: hypothetical protein WD249_02275 [Gaiellaceae bacterium]